MESFNYSDQFKQKVKELLRGTENWPEYERFIEGHLSGPNSREFYFKSFLCKEIEFHCGSLRDKQVLDFGCGTGATTLALAYYAEDITAFDIDRESLEICQLRLKERGINKKVNFFYAKDIDDIKDEIGRFDLILLNGVIEHIPLALNGLRKHVLNSAFDLLTNSGYLYINETPNRLWPIDFHTTCLWWIPWTKPGSRWSYNKALRKKKIAQTPRISQGTLGFEELGAWGTTYWEIMRCLKDEKFKCINKESKHGRHIHYSFELSWKKKIIDATLYAIFVKIFRLPLTTFAPFINNLVIQKA